MYWYLWLKYQKFCYHLTIKVKFHESLRVLELLYLKQNHLCKKSVLLIDTDFSIYVNLFIEIKQKYSTKKRKEIDLKNKLICFVFL